MAINIKDGATDALARELARRTGETLTGAVRRAIEERLERVRGQRPGRDLAEELDAIGQRCGALPVQDDRTPDQILGYDDVGVPR